MVHRVLSVEELRRRALGRRAHAKRRVLWAWFIVLAIFLVGIMQGDDGDPSQIPILVFAAIALLFASALTVRYLLTRQ